MTCIAGIIDASGRGHIACDSLGSDGYTKSVYKNAKVFKKGRFLFGYTSSYRMGQLLEHKLSLPARKVEQQLDAYMYGDFIDAVRSTLKENGYLSINSNKESIGEFLVITEARIFRVQDDMSLLESEEAFDTCGSGGDFAKASISILKRYTKLSNRMILTKAIETAATYVSSVGGKIRYLHD